MNRRFRGYRQCGYTLLEMVVTLPLMTVLIAGAVGAINIVSRTAADGGLTEPLTRGPAALDLMCAEIECATTILSRTTTSISMTTPDRTGNSVDETINYSWSGTPGDPLVRIVNGSSVNALTGVQALTLNYRTKTINSIAYLQTIEMRLSTASGSIELTFCIRCLNEPVAP